MISGFLLFFTNKQEDILVKRDIKHKIAKNVDKKLRGGGIIFWINQELEE